MASRVVMPKLSDTMEEGVILRWYKHEGDRVESGDALAEIETDKAVMDLEAYASGVLRKVLAPERAKVPAGGLIAVIARADEDISGELAGAGAPAAGKPAPRPPAGDRSAAERPQAGGVTPRARKMAEEAALPIERVHGSGPGGLVTERDVRTALEARETTAQPPPLVQPDAAERVVPFSPMRKTIAKRMTQSWQVAPHFYITAEIAMERVLDRRGALKKAGTDVTLTDFLVRAAALTLRQFPQFNTSYGDSGIVVHHGVHIGVAVGLDEGLITPVIRDADRKSLTQIAIEARDLIGRAKTRRLEPNEYAGATFSISNLGMFEVENFIAIIPPPEAAILAVGAVREIPVVQDGKVVVGRRMKVTLSNDHRVVDGMQAAQFLRALRERLEAPQRLE